MYKIELRSPYFDDDRPASFNVNFNGSGNGNSANEIVKIIRFISEDQQELKEILSKNKEAHLNHENLTKLIEEYNRWISMHHEELLREYRNSDKRASKALIKYLMVLVYNRSIQEPDKLNQYEPFSPEVYGETSFDLIDNLLKRVPLEKNDIFMDLGSGVGNVVLHVAAAANCKCCYGFEKAEWPALYAVKMEREFKFWMNFFGRAYSKFKLYKADFLSDEEKIRRYNPVTNTDGDTITMNDYVKEIINEAKLIFVNNYAFGAEVDHQLKLRFCNMLEGSLIVSSKPFCSLNFRINSRNLNDIGTILNVSEEPLNGKVSWTDRPIDYYFHRIDRTLLEKYFERLKNPKSARDEEYQANSVDSKHRKSTSSLVISTSSGSTQSSAASSPTLSNSSLNSSPSSEHRVKKAKSVGSTRKSIESRSKSGKKKNKKRKNDHSHSPDAHKAKLMKKNAKKLSSARVSRSKSLDNTLASMHRQVAKHDLNTTINAELSTKYNIKSLTTLKDENLDKKSLKDCKISSKFKERLKKDFENNRSHSLPRLSEKQKIKSKNFSLLKSKSKEGLTEEEEITSRQKLGVNIMNAVDVYLKKMQKHYVKYLMHLKSSEYEEKIKLELKTERERKTELLARKQKIEKLSSSLHKSNVELLRKRAEELGIKNLESPYQLIEYARKMLSDNKQLNKKIDIVQKKVNNLNFNKHKQVVSGLSKNDSNDGFLEKTNSRLQNLDLLLKKIDSKYSYAVSEIKHKNGFKSCYFESMNEFSVKSVESARSADETLSATEKNDDDDQNMADLDEELKTLNTKYQEDNNVKSVTKKGLNSNKLNSPKTATPPTLMSPAGDKYDQLLNGNRNLDSWRSFKIPKQHKSISEEVDSLKSSILSKTQTPIPSPTLSTSSSSSSTNNRTCESQTAIPRQISYDSTSSSSSNSFNSKNVTEFSQGNGNNQNTNFSDKSYTNSYYHPKKKQFRQYMMENSNSAEMMDIHHQNSGFNSVNNMATRSPVSVNSFNQGDQYHKNPASNSSHLMYKKS